MDPGKHLNTQIYDYSGYHLVFKVLLLQWSYRDIIFQPRDGYFCFFCLSGNNHPSVNTMCLFIVRAFPQDVGLSSDK